MWYRCHKKGEKSGRNELIDELSREGVDLSIPEIDPPVGPGLFLLDRVDGEICESLFRDSQQGYNRVIAVVLRGSVLTGGATWQLLHSGAADVFELDAVKEPAAIIAARFQRYAQTDELLASPAVKQNLVGSSRVWLSVLRQIVETARFSDASVLITGESGTGKELIARLIHALDPRPNKGPFIVLDCTTVSPELAGSEFFGHERGAFTTAVSAREGAFSLADGGTLFLDEVGELPLTLQAELLRVVQERTYKRVGSNTWKEVNFRMVCATNRNLLEEQLQGAFRRDFYYRIASCTCRLPSLKERRDDILPLARHFLEKMNRGAKVWEFDPAIRDYLLTRDYPGNIRDLRHLIVRIASRHVGDGPITVGDIPEEERLYAAEFMQKIWHDGAFQCAIRRALALGLGLKEINSRTAEVAIKTALDDEDGNLRRAAHRLGVTDRALQLRRAAQRGEMSELR